MNKNSQQAIKNQIASLRKEIEHHNNLYYVQDQPEISDSEYDSLVQKLLALESEHQEFVSLDSPTQRVGAPPPGRFFQDHSPDSDALLGQCNGGKGTPRFR